MIEGIIIESDKNKMYSLLHPLESFKPIDTFEKHNNENETLFYVSNNQPLLATRTNSTVKIYLIRQSLEELEKRQYAIPKENRSISPFLSVLIPISFFIIFR